MLTLGRELGFWVRASCVLIHMLAVLRLGTVEHKGTVREGQSKHIYTSTDSVNDIG